MNTDPKDSGSRGDEPVNGRSAGRLHKHGARALAMAVVLLPAVSMMPKLTGASPSSVFVSVDARVELFSVIYLLAGEQPTKTGRVLSDYELRVAEHFSRYRNHPAVAWVTQLKASREETPSKWFDYGVHVSLAVHVTDLPDLEVRVPLDPWPETLHRRWTPEMMDEFLARARDFAREADFSTFLDDQRVFYSEAVSKAERALGEGIDLQWFDQFFGPGIAAECFVFLSPLAGPNNFAFWIRENDKVEVVSVTGVWRAQWLSPWGSGPSVVVHEFTHAFVNPAVQAHREQLAKAVNRIKPSLIGDFGRRIDRVELVGFVHESLVRAAVIKYLDSRWGPLVARRQLGKELKEGLFWMPELLLALDDYERQRQLYPSFRAYMPVIVAFFESYSAQVESKATVARVANAMLPVGMALLAANGLLLWFFSREQRGTAIQTKWDWPLKVAMAWAVFVSLAEFVVLGSRPGPLSLVLGGGLLMLSALIILKPRWIQRRATIHRQVSSDTGLLSKLCQGRWNPIHLSCLCLVTGTPLLMSAQFAWGFTVLAVLVMFLRGKAQTRAAV